MRKLMAAALVAATLGGIGGTAFAGAIEPCPSGTHGVVADGHYVCVSIIKI